MNAHFERGRLLFNQRRYAEATQELTLALGLEPDVPESHCLLAFCLARDEKYDEATRHTEQAIALAPDRPASHYALALVWLQRNDPRKAEAAVREAIALDPFNASYHWLFGMTRFAQAGWEDALAAATAALAIDPEHVDSLNLRAESLRRLGRAGPAESQLRAALAVNADDPQTHANLGWLALQNGARKPAIAHFREALRLNPELESARRGVVEALKAWNPVYRLFLAFLFRMQRLGTRGQWLVILGAWFFYQCVRQWAISSPAMAPILWPLCYAYLAFVVITWLASPLGNLALRLHPWGNLALSRDERTGANWIGGFLLAAIVAGIGYFITENRAAGDLALGCGLMVLPLAATFSIHEPTPRRRMKTYTLVVGLAGLFSQTFFALPAAWQKTQPQIVQSLAGLGVSVFIFGAVLSLIAANVMRSIRWKR